MGKRVTPISASGHGLAGRRSASDSFTLMADSDIKALTEALPGESFETMAFTTPPPLANATVAIVTTASLHHPDQDDFAVMDTGYRVLDDSRRDRKSTRLNSSHT